MKLIKLEEQMRIFQKMRISPKNTSNEDFPKKYTKKRHTVGVEVEARTLVAHQKREEGQPLALRAPEQPQIGNLREAVEGLDRELALAAHLCLFNKTIFIYTSILNLNITCF